MTSLLVYRKTILSKKFLGLWRLNVVLWPLAIGVTVTQIFAKIVSGNTILWILMMSLPVFQKKFGSSDRATPTLGVSVLWLLFISPTVWPCSPNELSGSLSGCHSCITSILWLCSGTTQGNECSSKPNFAQVDATLQSGACIYNWL